MINYDIEEFCCEHCLVGNVINAMFELADIKDGDYTSVAIICKEDLAEKLLRVFTNIEVNGFGFNIDFVEFDKPDYDKEYAITIDTEGNMSLMKTYLEDEFVSFGEDLVFISDECNCKIFIEQCDYDEDAVRAFTLTDNE